MYVVTVLFKVHSQFVSQFHQSVVKQAADSCEQEPDCHRFDVCTSRDGDGVFFLYEIYSNEAAFDEHLQSAHFINFDQQVSSWVQTKNVTTWNLKEVKK